MSKQAAFSDNMNFTQVNPENLGIFVWHYWKNRILIPMLRSNPVILDSQFENHKTANAERNPRSRLVSTWNDDSSRR